MVDKTEVISWGILFGSFVVIVGMLLLHDSNTGKQQGIDHVRKVCEETGMYLTEGYAISCRVLKEGGKQ